MAVFKCKMCGGTLEINNETVATCQYCGLPQTLPKLADDRKANMYDRASHFRRNNEFDKAMSIYEQILNEDNTDAESYWSLVLCRYGIEYIEDPSSHKRLPTVNRAQFTSVFDDEDYKSAIRYADGYQKSLYEAEAKTINEIQKGILEISQKEAPFDVFICYKESDASGRRTPDSVLATELYHELCKEGYKVFFSRITLEDKLGTAYEPYIFAALNSAKVMVVLGTRQEYFNAAWVKNEWSRYLSLIKNGAKKILIPAYRDMDPYDLPEEFSHLQAQDMSKLGFMQDLIRGIGKIVSAEKSETATVRETVVQTGATNIEPLLERAFMFLEDGDFARADEFCEQILNAEPKNAQAYLGKLMAELKIKTRDDLKNCAMPFNGSNNYQKAMRFGDDALKAELEGYIKYINDRNKSNQLNHDYNKALNIMSAAETEEKFKQAAEIFRSISGHKNSADLLSECLEKAEEVRKNNVLSKAKNNMQYLLTDYYEEAIGLLKSIPGWKEADELVIKCEETLVEIKAKAEADRLERERKAELAKIATAKRKKLFKKIATISAPSLVVVIAVVILVNSVIIPASNYSKAGKLAENGDYASAAICYGKSGDFKDADEKSFELWDKIAVRETVSTGFYHTVGLKNDGTFVAVGSNHYGQCDVSGWADIVAVSAGEFHTVGLKSDGTVVAVGSKGYGKCDVGEWTDIVAISAGDYHTVGLKSDGTVVAVGSNYSGRCDVAEWTDIVAVSAGKRHTVGLKSDGTVVAVGGNYSGECDVAEWTDIVAVSAGYYHTVGLKSDGTVVAVGYNNYGQCDVSGWEDIVAISAGGSNTVGLKSDGTVVAVGYNYSGQCDVSDWTDIVAVSTGDYHTIGLKSDGTVVAVGDNDNGQCDVSDWKNIKQPK